MTTVSSLHIQLIVLKLSFLNADNEDFSNELIFTERKNDFIRFLFHAPIFITRASNVLVSPLNDLNLSWRGGIQTRACPRLYSNVKKKENLLLREEKFYE